MISFLQLLKEEVHKHEPQFQLIQQNSNEFVSNGRNVMEPYRRLLDRRWEDLEAKISDLEDELDSVKRSQHKSRVDTEVIVKERKMISRPGVTEEFVRTEELVGSEAGVPMFEETITTRRTYPMSGTSCCRGVQCFCSLGTETGVPMFEEPIMTRRATLTLCVPSRT